MSSILQVVQGLEKNIGFPIRRILPVATLRSVGPFVFFDHMESVEFTENTTEGDVRPHPHIGLATVTYLFSGAFMHRDHLGNTQRITPGDINWMSAGRGIVHSERIPEDIRADHTPLHGLQMWVALPVAEEQGEPGFWHYPSNTLPTIKREGMALQVLVGHALGRESPVKTLHPTLYVAGRMASGKAFTIDPDYTERAVYVVSGELVIEEQILQAGEMAVLKPGEAVPIAAHGTTTFMLLGGEPLEQPRYVWWNFVASDKALIEAAKVAWENSDQEVFPDIPGETERIPLP